MYKFEEINLYQEKLDLKEFVKEVNIEEMDEPVNICDLSVLAKKYTTWLRFMPRVKPYYAVKCNDDGRIVKELANLGTGFDCASKNEIKLALEMGASPESIIFANPCKPASHLRYAKEKRIMTSTVDTEYEIYKIAKHYPESNLVIRFLCEAKDAQCPLGDKFGCNAEADAASLMLLAKSLSLSVTGISFHVGSGCNDFPAYNRAISIAKNLFKFGEMIGYNMKILDIGGGFPGADDDKFATIAEIVNASLEKYFPDENVEIISEPGRFFVASAYTLVCKIHAKRDVRSEKKADLRMYYINDGVYGSFNCILYDHQKVTAEHFLEENDNLQKFKTLIWGPSCDALDKITDDAYLPNLSCGDLIAFPNMGAYTVPIASPFNGFLVPKTLYFKAN
ncbi:ornithine decarboxylase 1-like [Rhagoletis pomonella]|uniref:ornithine decarboxylase 1-like n=1 Tax=Rhagoletis pomonella TaxID=28610 RepID=UPI00177DDEE9|nr:ornithine decarboxylase 1-like [Rhagoletis pomonella]